MITLFFRYDNIGNKMKLVDGKATPRGGSDAVPYTTIILNSEEAYSEFLNNHPAK